MRSIESLLDKPSRKPVIVRKPARREWTDYNYFHANIFHASLLLCSLRLLLLVVDYLLLCSLRLPLSVVDYFLLRSFQV